MDLPPKPMETTTKDKLNTIYIVSKGRPQCRTAQTLTKIGYPGEWFIVCGTNDETLPEYRSRWGDRVLTFDWYDEVKDSDLLDNFGVETMGSGAVPVRNATRRIAAERGELRHWQFDDDYTAFYTKFKQNRSYKHVDMNGIQLAERMKIIAQFAHKAHVSNVGFAVEGEFREDTVFKTRRRVFNAHNMPTDEQLFNRWRGRMNDDLINAIEMWRYGRPEFSFLFMCVCMKETQSEKGGNTEIYNAHGTVRKTAYAVLIDPKNVKLVVKYGRYHHKADWKNICPKVLPARFAK